jgi:hypothetical protein
MFGVEVPQDYTEARPEVVAEHLVDAWVCLRPPRAERHI